MTQTARVTLTLSNIATEEDVNNLREELTQTEERIMSALSDAVASIRTAVEGVSGRLGDPAALEAAVAAERARYDALVSAEATEDVAQDAELQAARAEVDRLVGEQTSAAGELVTLAEQLNSVGTAVEETDDTTPVGEVVVPEPSEPTPAPEAPAPGEGVPTEDAPADAGVSPDGGAPLDAGPTPSDPASPPAGGPTDAAGNPTDGPNL